jgi:hypothetical protein
MLRSVTIVNGSTVLRSVDQRNPLVNASCCTTHDPEDDATQQALRFAGSQLNRRANEPISVVVHQVCELGIALDAVPCGRRPDARSVGP